MCRTRKILKEMIRICSSQTGERNGQFDWNVVGGGGGGWDMRLVWDGVREMWDDVW